MARAALYVYPGDFERRGLQCNLLNSNWDATAPNGTESQYMVAGARVVWENQNHSGGFDPDIRVTYSLPNLIQSTTGVVDLLSGELLERTTFYPNGARETLRTNVATLGGAGWGTEPLGFTGKEGDDEVGRTYFGERYLLQHLGRWASADPLQVHAGGGGEFGNSYHYVSGNLLQARDPLGLDVVGAEVDVQNGENTEDTAISTRAEENADRFFASYMLGLTEAEQQLFAQNGREITVDETRLSQVDRSTLSYAAQMLIAAVQSERVFAVVAVPSLSELNPNEEWFRSTQRLVLHHDSGSVSSQGIGDVGGNVLTLNDRVDLIVYQARGHESTPVHLAFTGMDELILQEDTSLQIEGSLGRRVGALGLSSEEVAELNAAENAIAGLAAAWLRRSVPDASNEERAEVARQIGWNTRQNIVDNLQDRAIESLAARGRFPGASVIAPALGPDER